METTYQVTGMHCGKCVEHVTEHVGAIAGVEKVEVDVEAGLVHVTSPQPTDTPTVAKAVAAAGYELQGDATPR